MLNLLCALNPVKTPRNETWGLAPCCKLARVQCWARCTIRACDAVRRYDAEIDKIKLCRCNYLVTLLEAAAVCEVVLMPL